MRLIPLVIIALFAHRTQAQATIGFGCHAEDKAAKLEISGAYGTSIGSGQANFGVEIAIKDARVPDMLRNLTLDRSHVSQNWFNDRDLRIMTYWQPQDTALYREVVMIVATRRGKAEESPYRGQYRLLISFMPTDTAQEATRLELYGRIECGTG